MSAGVALDTSNTVTHTFIRHNTVLLLKNSKRKPSSLRNLLQISSPLDLDFPGDFELDLGDLPLLKHGEHS